jgi:hypothetical protein
MQIKHISVGIIASTLLILTESLVSQTTPRSGCLSYEPGRLKTLTLGLRAVGNDYLKQYQLRNRIFPYANPITPASECLIYR